MKKKQEKNKVVETQPSKKVLAFFVIMFPSLLIVSMGMLSIASKVWWVLLGLFVYQSIVLKQFLDSYYEEE